MNKGKCLLAPVPALLMPDALEIANAGGVVAFGSNSLEVLNRLRSEGAEGSLQVYIVVSSNGYSPENADHSKLKVGKVQFKGMLAAIINADRHGRHLVPERRPKAALDGDTAAALFWEVEGLHEIKPALTVSSFLNASGKPWHSTPEGPVEARRRQQET